MAKAKATPTIYAKTVAAENAKFRADQRKRALEDTDLHNAGRTDDIDAFRKDAYKQALRDAKAARA